MDAMSFDPETSDPNPAAVHVKRTSGKRHEKNYGEKKEGKFEKSSKSRDHGMNTQVEE